ncbi:AHH domain-containing protein [Paraburkholderia caribensis]|uniref:AHH domain-containing protein n=1 Tax=Paraburkholderia caribensis TaxID=75105 RepID=UPI00386638A4
MHLALKRINNDIDNTDNGISLKKSDDEVSPTARHQGNYDGYTQTVKNALDKINLNQSNKQRNCTTGCRYTKRRKKSASRRLSDSPTRYRRGRWSSRQCEGIRPVISSIPKREVGNDYTERSGSLGVTVYICVIQRATWSELEQRHRDN